MGGSTRQGVKEGRETEAKAAKTVQQARQLSAAVALALTCLGVPFGLVGRSVGGAGWMGQGTRGTLTSDTLRLSGTDRSVLGGVLALVHNRPSRLSRNTQIQLQLSFVPALAQGYRRPPTQMPPAAKPRRVS